MRTFPTYIHWLIQVVEATNRQLWYLLVFLGKRHASVLQNLHEKCQHHHVTVAGGFMPECSFDVDSIAWFEERRETLHLLITVSHIRTRS